MPAAPDGVGVSADALEELEVEAMVEEELEVEAIAEEELVVEAMVELEDADVMVEEAEEAEEEELTELELEDVWLETGAAPDAVYIDSLQSPPQRVAESPAHGL
jgi:hypothetical protein